MRFSVCLAAHNEGDLLRRTLHAVRASLLASSFSAPATPGDHPRCEIIVIDDASTDGSVAAALADFPNSPEFPLLVERFETRQGASPAKHRAAELARGAVLLFLDAHVLPEAGSLERLVAGVEASQGRDLLTPALPALDESTFTVIPGRTGLGYGLDLADLSCRWLPLSNLQLDEETRLYRQPALIGCVLAVARETYFALGGFDAGMKVWGVEDIDFGLKAWFLGYGLRLDVMSRVAHRFQRAFDHYEVPAAHVLHNKLRMAAKHLSPHHLRHWLANNTPLTLEQLLTPSPIPLKDLTGGEGRGEGEPAAPPASHTSLPPVWQAALALFHTHSASLQSERALVQGRRVRDELDYAHTFGLTWPGHDDPQPFALAMTLSPGEESGTEPSPWPSTEPSPEPSPEPSEIPHLVTAVNDSATTSLFRGIRAFDPRGNDSDTLGHALSLVSVGQPAHGQTVIAPDGLIVYVAKEDYVGLDSFTYKIDDGNGETASASVNVSISDDPFYRKNGGYPVSTILEQFHPHLIWRLNLVRPAC